MTPGRMRFLSCLPWRTSAVLVSSLAISGTGVFSTGFMSASVNSHVVDCGALSVAGQTVRLFLVVAATASRPR